MDRLEIPDHYLRETVSVFPSDYRMWFCSICLQDVGMESYADDLWQDLLASGKAEKPLGKKCKTHHCIPHRWRPAKRKSQLNWPGGPLVRLRFRRKRAVELDGIESFIVAYAL